MRKGDRTIVQPPSCLDAKDAQGKSELDRSRDHQNSVNPKKKAFQFSAYRNEEVRRALARIFHGKCAYCETVYAAASPVDIEHFRPKGEVTEDSGHPGYWWLAMKWENLLPSCIDCNRRRWQYIVGKNGQLAFMQSGKKNSFPLQDGSVHARKESDSLKNESPLLLDPTVDDPRDHIRFHMDPANPIGIVMPHVEIEPSKRGIASIQIYGLNRIGLVQERTRILRQLEFMGNLAVDLGCIIEDLEAPPLQAALEGSAMRGVPSKLRLLQDTIFGQIREMELPTAPYSEMVRAWINDFTERMGK